MSTFSPRSRASSPALWICAALFLFPASRGAVAGEWLWQSPLPQGNDLWHIAYADSITAFAAGLNGTIMVTRDRGLTWEVQYEGITDHLRDIFAMDRSTAWLVGDDGVIFHTTNSGAQWLPQQSGTVNGLNGVFFFDGLHGWACGDKRTIIATSDGGATWSDQSPGHGQAPFSLNTAWFTSPQEGWTAGEGGTLWHTTNGGALWSQQGIVGATVFRMRFYTPRAGILVGASGLISITTDGGGSWNTVVSGTMRSLNDIAIDPVSQRVWIAGDNAAVLYAPSPAGPYTRDSLQTYASLFGITCSGSDVLVVGEYGTIARSSSVLPWTFVNTGMHPAANWLVFADSRHGVAAGQYGWIARTSDGGTTWTTIRDGISGDSFYGVAMPDPRHAWACGDLGDLIYSSDGGSTWTQQSTNTTSTLLSIAMIDSLRGWAAGDVGTLLVTTDGGSTWRPLQSGTTEVIYGIAFTDMENGWMAGAGGQIRRTTDGGLTWHAQPSPVSSTLYSVSAVDMQRLTASGEAGVVLLTTNGGDSWSLSPTGCSTTIAVARGTAWGEDWAAGDSGLVLHGSNGGASWSRDWAKSQFAFYGTEVLYDTLAWICGDNGTIMRHTGTAAPASVHLPAPAAGGVPSGITLEQNYPNPFNPVTRIRYSLTHRSTVTLTVFDMLGRQVADLFSGDAEAGFHEVIFDGSHLASGVYYYRLLAGRQRETRRLLLVR